MKANVLPTVPVSGRQFNYDVILESNGDLTIVRYLKSDTEKSDPYKRRIFSSLAFTKEEVTNAIKRYMVNYSEGYNDKLCKAAIALVLTHEKLSKLRDY